MLGSCKALRYGYGYRLSCIVVSVYRNFTANGRFFSHRRQHKPSINPTVAPTPQPPPQKPALTRHHSRIARGCRSCTSSMISSTTCSTKWVARSRSCIVPLVACSHTSPLQTKSEPTLQSRVGATHDATREFERRSVKACCAICRDARVAAQQIEPPRLSMGFPYPARSDTLGGYVVCLHCTPLAVRHNESSLLAVSIVLVVVNLEFIVAPLRLRGLASLLAHLSSLRMRALGLCIHRGHLHLPPAVVIVELDQVTNANHLDGARRPSKGGSLAHLPVWKGAHVQAL